MRFAKFVNGSVEKPEVKKIVEEAQTRLSSIFLELSFKSDSTLCASEIGGDCFIHQMVVFQQHICDLSTITIKELEGKLSVIEKELIEQQTEEKVKEFVAIQGQIKKLRADGVSTAATTGSKFIWNPEFINKLSMRGLRLVVNHEGSHGYLTHPQRRGHRNPALYNIIVDFKVNYLLMRDLKARGFREPAKIFTEHLGEFISLNEYLAILTDPFNPPPRLEHFNPIYDLKAQLDPEYKHPGDALPPMYYAEPDLPEDLKRPESIYDLCMKQIPRCKLCNRLGVYEKPAEYKKLEKKLGKGAPNHSKKDCKNPAHCDNCGCPEDGNCAGYPSMHIDPFNSGALVDAHMDTDISEDELAKKMRDAAELSKSMGGSIPDYVEEELGRLEKPKLSWMDFIRQTVYKKRQGIGHNNWALPKRKPLFAGLWQPTKEDLNIRILIGLDCSGSMSKEQAAYGVQQLQALHCKAEILIVPWTTQCYWENLLTINKADVDTLSKVKMINRGGTDVAPLFAEYEDKVGAVDLVVVISDMFLGGTAHLKRPPKGTDVLWLQVAMGKFLPAFGRVMQLFNES